MPIHDSIALPADELLRIRRLYFTVGATIQALEYLMRSKNSPANAACAAEVMDLCYFKVGELLDELQVPCTWRECVQEQEK